MSKYLKDDWGDKFIGSNDTFYLVNYDIVHSDYITEIPTTLYQDSDGNYIDKDEIVKFYSIEEYINYLKQGIEYYKDKIEIYKELNYINILNVYRNNLKTYEKLLNNIEEVE
jgi:hypothetical protein